MGKVKIYISGPIAHYDLHERKHASAHGERKT